jgi:hypothetical protein
MSDIATQSSSLRGPRNTDQATGPKLAAPERKQRMTVSCIKRDSPERHKIWSAFRDPHEGEGCLLPRGAGESL